MSQRVLNMGMVGGGKDAFIGAVHRRAACLDLGVRFVAGCLSSSPAKALESGRELGLATNRNYATWHEMLASELKLPPGERIDFVSIVTPNHVHAPVAKAFAEAGINVVCDKPLCMNSAEAASLVTAQHKSGVVFAVTYVYTGYPMVKQARHIVANGDLGDIRKVIVEYNQGWLASKLEASGQKQADWRTDPSRSGAGGAIGDIGSHAENLISTITSLRITHLCADLTSFVEGRRVDDDANVLLRFDGGARGVLIASQIEIGHENDLRIRVFGTKGTLDWRQEEPNELWHRKVGEPDAVLRRGNAYLCDAAKGVTRLPPGHPEAFFEAFANVYAQACAAMRAKLQGGPRDGKQTFDYPTLTDGARGVLFIEKTVESSRSDRKWTPMNFSMP